MCSSSMNRDVHHQTRALQAAAANNWTNFRFNGSPEVSQASRRAWENRFRAASSVVG